MRIVGGRWAGRSLTSPSGRVRPTAEAVRTAMVEMLGDAVKGARVVDLFAGTGALGLEALSHGAKYCDFVENGPSAIHSLKANVAALRVGEKARIYKIDAIPFVERLERDRYDIALVDPPYGSRKLDRVLAYWREVPFSSIIAFEHAADHEDLPRGMIRHFGETSITVLQARTAKPDTHPPRRRRR